MLEAYWYLPSWSCGLAKMRHRRETIDYYLTISVVLRRKEKGEVEAHDGKNLTLSWGTGLTEAISKLTLDKGVGLSYAKGSQT